MRNLIFIFLGLCLSSCSSNYKRSTIHEVRDGDLSYRDLMLKDYDEMHKAVQNQIKMAQDEFRQSDSDDEDSLDSGLLELKRALRLIFSRPNSDNMIAKLVPEVRRELAVYDAYPKVINELAKEGIRAFDKKLGVATVTMSTYTFMLDNMMAEIQAEARQNSEMRAVIQLVADAKLEIPRDVVNERKLSGMFMSESPSETAKKILERITPKKKK